jgi:hypothetical protein
LRASSINSSGIKCPNRITGISNGYLLLLTGEKEVGTMSKTMVIEPVRAFNGMDVLVACDEGLFEAEGLEVQFASRAPGDIRSAAEGTLEYPVSTQGRLQERGVARMYQA